MKIKDENISNKEVRRIIKVCLREGTLIKCNKCRKIYLFRFDSPTCPHNNLSLRERRTIVNNTLNELKLRGILQ